MMFKLLKDTVGLRAKILVKVTVVDNRGKYCRANNLFICRLQTRQLKLGIQQLIRKEPEVEVPGKIVSSFNEADNEITYRKC